jgi:hypothetical protein
MLGYRELPKANVNIHVKLVPNPLEQFDVSSVVGTIFSDAFVQLTYRIHRAPEQCRGAMIGYMAQHRASLFSIEARGGVPERPSHIQMDDAKHRGR